MLGYMNELQNVFREAEHKKRVVPSNAFHPMFAVATELTLHTSLHGSATKDLIDCFMQSVVSCLVSGVARRHIPTFSLERSQDNFNFQTYRITPKLEGFVMFSFMHFMQAFITAICSGATPPAAWLSNLGKISGKQYLPTPVHNFGPSTIRNYLILS